MLDLVEFRKMCEQNRIEEEKGAALYEMLKGKIKPRKYGLVWEEQEEDIEKSLKDRYTVLREVEEREIKLDKGGRTHSLIEGDNLEALTFLKNSGKKVDVIYIDPPYNTMNSGFVYNDNYVDKEDSWRHSKWLSFMNKRLVLARELLTEDGVIFISIDEYEFAQLKLLCDLVFGEGSFIENFIWVKNSTKNNSKTTSTNHEYVLCYAKNIDKVKAISEFFRVKKAGFDNVLNLIEKEKNEGKTSLEAQEVLRKYLRSKKELKGISAYKNIDENYRIFRISDSSAPGGNGPRYDVIHPLTGKVCKVPGPGWRYTEETMKEHIKNGRIYFGESEGNVPQYKRYLVDVESEVQKSIIEDNTDGKKELQSVFEGKSPFNNPKPTTLLKTLLHGIPNDNAVVLDFFAGSGTTAHAVLELNREDGGNRQVILCTNNENNIAEEVTYERIKRVMEGYTTPKGKAVEGIPGNLRYFKVDSVAADEDIYTLEDNLLEVVVPFIQFKEDAWTITTGKKGFTYLDDRVTIYNDPYHLDEDFFDHIKGNVFYIYDGWMDYLDIEELKDIRVVPIPKEFFKLFR